MLGRYERPPVIIGITEQPFALGEFNRFIYDLKLSTSDGTRIARQNKACYLAMTPTAEIDLLLET